MMVELGEFCSSTKRLNVVGAGIKLITLLQLTRGQMILCDVILQIKRQLHGHLTYFFIGGAGRIGVASPHAWHLITCKCNRPSTCKSAWHTLQFMTGISDETVTLLPDKGVLGEGVYAGGRSKFSGSSAKEY